MNSLLKKVDAFSCESNMLYCWLLWLLLMSIGLFNRSFYFPVHPQIRKEKILKCKECEVLFFWNQFLFCSVQGHSIQIINAKSENSTQFSSIFKFKRRGPKNIWICMHLCYNLQETSSVAVGTIPVVVGAPNIQDFVPCPGSVLHIKELKDIIDSIAKKMKYLAENHDAYNQSLRWKYHGPCDSFKALVDMAAVHSSCRLCIHLATSIRENEEKRSGFKKRPCKCSQGSESYLP